MAVCLSVCLSPTDAYRSEQTQILTSHLKTLEISGQSLRSSGCSVVYGLRSIIGLSQAMNISAYAYSVIVPTLAAFA